jgi:hypothetical protein
MTKALKGNKYDEGQITNLLAEITRISLFRLLDPKAAPEGDFPILETADVVRSDLVLAAQIQSVFGPPDEPDLAANDGIQVSIVYHGEPSNNESAGSI